MVQTSQKRVGFGVGLISLFYLFGAIVLLVTLFTNPAETASIMADRHGLSPETGVWFLPVLAVLGLAISYGLFSLSRWGFFLTVTYLLYFAGISLYLGYEKPGSVYVGNALWSIVVLIYLVVFARKRFLASVQD